MKKNILKFLLVLSLFFTIPFSSTLAQEEKKESISFIPQVTIPGSNFKAGASTTMSGSLSTLGDYVKSIYNYLILIVGLVAAIALMVAGIIWLTAAGNSTRISSAKSWIGGSLTGLVLALTSYLILQTINPNLVDFRDQNIRSISATEDGCCKLDNEKDTTGAFTGEKGHTMTKKSTATGCYNRAIELKEPGIKSYEALKKEFEDKKLEDKTFDEYVKDYIISNNKFFPNQEAFQFTSCGSTDVAVLVPSAKKTLTPEELTSQSSYLAITCFKVYDKNVYDQLLSAMSYWAGQGIKQPSSNNIVAYDISGKYFPDEKEGCNADFSNRNLKNWLSPEQLKLIKGSSKLFPNKTNKYNFFGAEDLGQAVNSFYEFNAIIYHGRVGKLGEPCGDPTDKGICINSIGLDCEDLGFVDQNIGYGGRACDTNLKCCNKK